MTSSQRGPVSAEQLRGVVDGLPEWTPVFEREWCLARHVTRARSSYRSEREHISRWLGEYDSAGYYGRKTPGRDARFFYTHFNDALGLVWLAEALGVDEALVRQGVAAVSAAGPNVSARAGAFRRVVGWAVLEPLVRQRLS